MFSFLNIQTLHNDYSYIILCTLDKYLPVFSVCCTQIFYPFEMLRGCLVCVICDSSSFHSFIFKLNMLWLLTHWKCVHPIFCSCLIIFRKIIIFGGDCWTWTLLRLHHLWIAYIVYMCVICNSNRFHSYIFKSCIIHVNTLMMCTGDAGPEQSLVLIQ